MSIKLVQYGGRTPDTTLSPMCAKAHMGLHFKGLEYEIENVGSPGEVKKYNPRGRMPALVIDGEVIVDSSDILTALDERFPDPPLAPDDPAGRALAHILEDWSDEGLYFYGLYLRWCLPDVFDRMKPIIFGEMAAPLRLIVPPIVRRQVGGRAQAQGIGLKDEQVVRRELSAHLGALVDFLGDKRFLVGDRFTRADLSVAANCDQLRNPELHPELRAEIDGIPALAAWLGRVHELVPNVAFVDEG